MPPTGPTFAAQLSDDLLDYGYTLLRLALVLQEGRSQLELARTAFERAAEAIESVVRNGSPEDPDLGFHRVIASCSYHLAHYSARSYSLLPTPETLNLAPAERCLVFLLRRNLTALRETCFLWLIDPNHADDQISEALAAEEGGIDLDDAFQLGLTATFMRALSTFDFALLTGSNELAGQAVERFAECEEASADLGAVPSWWTSKLAKNLVSDLWEQSLHRQLSPEILGDGSANWPNLRSLFVSLLQSKRVAQIELWPSQLDAVKRVTSAEDDLVVSLPTSAGKTRIAEMCILRALSGQRRVVYVTPLRALSAQVERDLREVFQPLGFTVSSLYGASGEVGLDTDTLSNRDIVVSTPEKLDFALRQDASLLDDVGLIVLDEAHTIGPGEREVRYEVLVQRLLRRPDSSSRRLVCLSAILPRGEQLDDFVSWIRQGDTGEAVIANWRPTRQRFGTIRWNAGDQYARLDLNVEDENAFLQRFIQAIKVPKARTRMFPKDSGELTLAVAWQIAKDGRSALIFCPQKNLVASLARKLLDVYDRGALERLGEDSAQLERAKRVGREWLGSDHPAVRCLSVGVAVHHAGLPKAYLREVENLLRARQLPIVIASPTLAQGLNLSASTLLMYSIRRGTKVISGEDFGNVIGRAGRAHVDIDGQILYVLFEPTAWRLQEWEKLKAQARAKSIQSGLFALIALVLQRLQDALGCDKTELLEYVAGNSDAWDVVFAPDQQVVEGDPSEELASLDTAILALIEKLDCDVSELPKLLDEILQDSLWLKTLARKSDDELATQRALLLERGRVIWAGSTDVQRRGYFASGVGFATGQNLDKQSGTLNRLLFQAEQAIEADNLPEATNAALQLARIVFTIPPFAPKTLPGTWETVLSEWISGRPMAEIVASDPEGLVEFIETGVIYGLVWAIEAVRVRSKAHTDEFAELWTGRLAQTLEAGTTDKCAILLIHAGLGSRVAALAALSDIPGDFSDLQEMKVWLASKRVAQASMTQDWPTAETAELWRAFRDSLSDEATRTWTRQVKTYNVIWRDTPPPTAGSFLRIVGRGVGKRTEVHTSDFSQVGELNRALTPRPGVMYGVAMSDPNQIEIHYDGPHALK